MYVLIEFIGFDQIEDKQQITTIIAFTKSFLTRHAEITPTFPNVQIGFPKPQQQKIIRITTSIISLKDTHPNKFADNLLQGDCYQGCRLIFIPFSVHPNPEVLAFMG